MMMVELNGRMKIIKKILGQFKKGDQYRGRHNNELYIHIEKIRHTI